MRKLLLAVAFAALPAMASAQFAPFQPFQPFAPVGTQPRPYTPPAAPSTNYDWRSGNVTTTTPNYGGGASINGFNANTGSTWNTQVRPNGDMNGFDSRGNVWTYNRSSGSYINSDGTVCIGTGPTRTCS